MIKKRRGREDLKALLEREDRRVDGVLELDVVVVPLLEEPAPRKARLNIKQMWHTQDSLALAFR